MRGNEFLDKMELIQPAYVEAADIKITKKKHFIVKWGAVAACIALMVFAGIRFYPQAGSEPAPGLPMLTISDDLAGRGYEGYMANNISEIINANPWKKSSKISFLPVYENVLSYDENFIAWGADVDKMRELLLDVAHRLGIDTNNVIITDNSPDEQTKQMMTEKLENGGGTVPEGYFDPTALTIKTDEMEIQVDQSMTATVFFDPPVSLPDKYNFNHYAPRKDIAAVAEYLKKEYSEFIGIENPQINIYGGDYTIYGEQGYSIGFFDDRGNAIEQIINYNFNRVTFHCDDNGDLFIARIYQPDLSKKLGDYPIISVKQAEELLLNGNYITSVPYEVEQAKYIKKVELIYRAGNYDEVFMPYYRFYVELPEEKRDVGLKTYGAYYVPAVESSYISNMPKAAISFNK